MKFAEKFIKKFSERYGENIVRETILLMDDHYPTMSKLAAFYKANGKKLDQKHNIFYKEMLSLNISVKHVEIASAYFDLAKELEKRELHKYLKSHNKTILNGDHTYKILR